MRQAIRRMLDRLVAPQRRGAGYYEFLSRHKMIDKNFYYDALTDLIFKRELRDDANCVDVGCHQGAILQMMMAYAPKGKFFCFEPLPHLFEFLTEHYGDNAQVSLNNVALSDSQGESSFNYVISNPGYSGLLKRRYDRPEEEDIKITVKTELMDTVLGDTPVDVIKIDVEGAELQVLRGAKQLLKRDKPLVVFEHGLGAADYYKTRPEDIYELLCEDCGLSITLLNRFLKNQPPLTKAEFAEQFDQCLDYYFLAFKP
jgi:FkbM family methyltransferase